MYYSKSSSPSIPKNYSGNAFRVIDESNRTYQKDNEAPPPQSIDKKDEKKQEIFVDEKKNGGEIPLVSSFLSGISVEDILLLGLIFVIHEGNPNDPVLFLLLILLLSK